MRSVLEAISLLHGCEDHDALAERILTAVRHVVVCDAVYYTEVNVARQRAVHKSGDAAADAEVARLNPAYERYVQEHPLVAFAMRDPVPVTKVSDFLSQPRLHRLGIYREFFAPLDVERQIGVCLSGARELAVGLAICRSRRRPDFTERDRERLSLLRPHLIEAYRNVSARVDLREMTACCEGGLGALGACLVTVDARGRIRTETGGAWRTLSAVFPTGNGDALPGPVVEWLGGVVAERGRVDRPGAVNASADFAGPLGLLRVILIGAEARGGFTLVLRHQSAADPVARIHRGGLTRREAEVLSRLALGETNGQIAGALGVSPGTVRTHVERILAKLGVQTRTAAARVALGWVNEAI